MKKLSKVNSISDLFWRAKTDSRYAQLALISASNLGGIGKTLKEAYQTLCDNASAGDGCSEEDVVDEINFCRKLVK
jgi:hypothetical protein